MDESLLLLQGPYGVAIGVVLVTLMLVLAAYAGHKWNRFWRAVVLRGRRRRAKQAEDEAASVLRRAGYRIRGREVERSYRLDVAGEPLEVGLRCDYIVSRRGKLFVAEVKSGRSAPKPSNKDTRRQLLEYSLAYPVDGVLLVDMRQKRIREVVFPDASGPTRRPFWWFVCGLLVGASATLGVWHGLVHGW